MTAHVGHEQQGRAESLPTLGAFEDPLVSPAMILELLSGAKAEAAFQTSNLVPFDITASPFDIAAAPAARVLLVSQEVSLAGKLSQTRYAVDAPGFTLVLTVELG